MLAVLIWFNLPNLQLSCFYPIQAVYFSIVLLYGLLLHGLLLCVILIGGLSLCALYAWRNVGSTSYLGHQLTLPLHLDDQQA